MNIEYDLCWGIIIYQLRANEIYNRNKRYTHVYEDVKSYSKFNYHLYMYTLETTDGDVPDGDVPDGDVPDGDVPDGDVPDVGECFLVTGSALNHVTYRSCLLFTFLYIFYTHFFSNILLCCYN